MGGRREVGVAQKAKARTGVPGWHTHASERPRFSPGRPVAPSPLLASGARKGRPVAGTVGAGSRLPWTRRPPALTLLTYV